MFLFFPTQTNPTMAAIGGLPFTASGFHYLAGRVGGASAHDMIAQIKNNTKFMNLFHNASSLTNANLSGQHVFLSGSYMAS